MIIIATQLNDASSCHQVFVCFVLLTSPGLFSKNNRIITNTNNNKKAYFVAGLSALFLGLSVFAHPTSVLVIPGFIVYSFFTSRDKRKSFASFLIVLAIMVMFIALINYWRFGSLGNFGYGPIGSLSYHSMVSFLYPIQTMM